VEQVEGSNNAGFSLIELTVVVAILSILSVSVSLTLRGRPATADATKFTRAYDLARSKAIHSGQRHGLVVARQSFSAAHFLGGQWETSAQEQAFDGAATVRVVNAPVSDAPTLVFLPTGQTTAFEIDFSTAQNRQTCRTDGWAPLSCSTR
jgi:type II secretion system protein H